MSRQAGSDLVCCTSVLWREHVATFFTYVASRCHSCKKQDLTLTRRVGADQADAEDGADRSAAAHALEPDGDLGLPLHQIRRNRILEVLEQRLAARVERDVGDFLPVD